MSWASRATPATAAPAGKVSAKVVKPVSTKNNTPAISSSPPVTVTGAAGAGAGPRPGAAAGSVRGSWGKGNPLASASGAAASKAAPAPAPASSPSSKAKTSNRLTYLWTMLQGSVVRVRLMDGKVLEGVFSQFADDSVALCAVEEMAAGATAKGGPLKARMVVKMANVESVMVKGLRFGHASTATPTPKAGTFKTDGQISNNQVHQRQLESWKPDPEVAGSHADKFLDEEARQHSLGGWDQFKVNQQKFGVQSTYDFDLYTTKLDKDSEFFKQHERMANKLAAEIQAQKSGNVHVDRDRGHDGDDVDEEALFSAVSRDKPKKPTNPNSYVVPAKRGEDKSNGQMGNGTGGKWSSLVGSKTKGSPVGADAGEAPVAGGAKPTENVTAVVAGDKPEEKTADTKPAEKPKTKLNPNAKEFKFNPNANSFTPSFAAAPAPQMQQPVYGVMNQPHVYQQQYAPRMMVPMGVPMMQGPVPVPPVPQGMYPQGMPQQYYPPNGYMMPYGGPQ